MCLFPLSQWRRSLVVLDMCLAVQNTPATVMYKGSGRLYQEYYHRGFIYLFYLLLAVFIKSIIVTV